MSSTTDSPQTATDLDIVTDLYRNYYRDELSELIQQYPQEKRSIRVDYQDLFRKEGAVQSDSIARRIFNEPENILGLLSDGLMEVDTPVDVKLKQAIARVYNLPDEHIYGVSELRSEHRGQYLGVEGHISRVSEIKPKLVDATFECTRCGTTMQISQPDGDFQEPHECKGCERQGPFNLLEDRSDFVDRRRMQIKQPPQDAANGEGATITVELEGEIADPPEFTLESRVGEHVVVYGILKLDQETSGRQKLSTFEQYLDGRAFDFERDTNRIDVSEYKDEFTEAAKQPNAYELFIESLTEDIYERGRWEIAFRLGAAYLFGGVRVDPPDGSTYRGDIHMAIFGPPGVAKSKFSQNLADVSPNGERRSATGLSSEVGLIAAAVQDDFTQGNSWSLKSGFLPRVGDHAILDEGDKTDADLSRMNDALEGQQMATVDKAGIKAKLKTRVGLMVSGNPDGGRWDDAKGIKEQVDVDDSLWSRFDGIVFLQDEPDGEEDGQLAEHVLNDYRKNMARENGSDDETTHDTPLSKDALQAWVKYARDNIEPTLTDDAIEKLKEYYVNIRTDDNFHENSFPTPRKLETGVRYATAFARLRLSDTVEPTDVRMAIELSKSILGQSLLDGNMDANAFTEAQERNQTQRFDEIVDECGGESLTVSEVAERVKRDYDDVRDDLQTMQGQFVEKNGNNRYRIKEIQ